MPPKLDPGRLLYPGFTGRVMVDTWRGVVRVRKWPEKRGRPKSAAVRLQNEWFKEANRLAIRAPGSQMASAIAITRNSGLYPRDLLIRMMAGNLGPIPTEDGRLLTKATKRIEPVSFQGAILNLDALQAIVANVDLVLTWPLPVFDPLGLWSIANPTRLTVPNNVSVVRVEANFQVTPTSSTRLRGRLTKNGTALARLETGFNFTNGGSITSGPIIVEPGDYFEFRLISAKSGNIFNNGTTTMSLEFLTAV